VHHRRRLERCSALLHRVLHGDCSVQRHVVHGVHCGKLQYRWRAPLLFVFAGDLFGNGSWILHKLHCWFLHRYFELRCLLFLPGGLLFRINSCFVYELRRWYFSNGFRST